MEEDVSEKTHLLHHPLLNVENQGNNNISSSINNYNSLIENVNIVEEQIDSSSNNNPLGQSLENIDDSAELEFTYWYMKKRQWSRLQRGSFTNEKRGFSLLWFLFFLIIYGVYLFIQIYHFQRKGGYILEFILMGFISVSCGLVVPRFAWVVRIVFLEGYSTLFYFSITGAITLNADKENWVKGESNRFTITQRSCFKKPSTCVYEGPLLGGRPHGIGTWMDTSYQGELLSGYWEDGIPLGPFESMENDTRSLLVNLRIIYGTNGGGKSWLDRIPLNTGVASIECCVSGNFFKGYPKVSMIKGPDHCFCQNRCYCIKKLFDQRSYRHIDEDKTLSSLVVSMDKKSNSLTVTGYKSKHLSKSKKVSIEISKDKSQDKRLIVDSNWISSDSNEAILFIHGYDHDLKDALKRFAQFLALGHFPSYIKPFVFNWPSSTSPLLYWCAHSVASDNDNHRDLHKFIEALGVAGIRNLHIMCHSMGTRFLLRSFSKIKKALVKRKVVLSPNQSFNNVENVRQQERPSSSSKINLTNLIFLNPDYEINTFKNDYEELRQYCPSITIYADHRDVAIKMAFKVTQKQSLGNNIQPISDGDGGMLDVDIIDTGDLDSNMSERHHSFFNINRLMVDDLHDLIVTGKRATERTSRLKSVGDVFRFSILPSSVVVV
eukprot:gene7473-9181_t